MAKRLWKHLISILGSTVLNILSNVLLIPVFLSHLSLAAYGEWVALSTVTVFLANLDFGMNSAVTNRMLASFVKNDMSDYTRSQHSAMAFYVALASVVTVLTGLAVVIFPIAYWVNVRLTSPSDAAWIIWLLSLQVLWAMPLGLLGNTYRTIGEPSRTQWLNNIRSILVLAISLIVLMAGGTLKILALCQLAPWLVLSAAVAWDLKRRSPHLLPGISHAHIAIMRDIIKPSAVFGVIMVCMAITQQGSVLVISTMLGTTAVAVFATTRTLTNVAMQVVNVIKNAAWPDLTILFAQEDWKRLRKLLRLLTMASLTASTAVAVSLFFEGPEVLRVWTHHPIHVSRLFLGLFLVYVVFQAPWMICSGLLAAVNRHHRLALSYVASSLLGVTLAAVLTPRLGLAAIPLGLILGELFACYHFVVKDACDLIGESYLPFAGRLILATLLMMVPTLGCGWLAHQAACGPNILRWLEVGSVTIVVAALSGWWVCFDGDERHFLLYRMDLIVSGMRTRAIPGNPVSL